MITVRSVPVLCHLHHIETKFSLNVSFGVLGVGDFIAKLRAQHGKFNSSNAINSGVAHIVRRIVRQSAERECVFIDVGCVAQQVTYKIPCPCVVQQITEVFLSEWIVPHVLHQASSVSEGVGAPQVIGGRHRKALEQHRPKLILPRQIDYLLVCQNGIRREWGRYGND